MRFFTILLSVALVGTPATPGAPLASTGPSVKKIPRCLVSLIEEAQVPAQEAGVLVEINAREGQQVSKDGALGQIDTKQAELEKWVAELQLKVAQERILNDVNRRYAEKAAEVAQNEHEMALWLNEKGKKIVPAVEVDRLKLLWDKAILQIKQSLHDLKVFGLEAQVRQAELDAAKAQITRRQIRSPLDGEVEKVHRHIGEWVKPGDPAFHVVKMDRLRIEGFVKQSEYDPCEIDGRPVTVEVVLSRGQRKRFEAWIAIPSPLIQPGGAYRVWADVDNLRQDQDWVLRPGQLAEMTIHLTKPRNPQGPKRGITRSLSR